MLNSGRPGPPPGPPLFGRFAKRLGAQKALWAAAHRLLRLIWKLLHDKIAYAERGPRAWDSARLPAPDAGKPGQTEISQILSEVRLRRGPGPTRGTGKTGPKRAEEGSLN